MPRPHHGPKTIKPPKYTLDRAEKVRDHLQSCHPHREVSLTEAVGYAVWYVEQLLASGKLTQSDMKARKAEATL